MKEDKKVSIVIPAYNVESYIEKGIMSCIQQTYKNIEIIVVDDGSQDKTSEIIEKIARKDKRIKFFEKENGGVSSARNLGLQNVTGDYVIFLDSDDWLEFDAISELLYQQSQDNKAFILTDRYLITRNRNGQEKKVFPGQGKKKTEISAEKALLNVGNGKYNLQSACYKLFDMCIITNSNLLFDESLHYGEDGLFVFEYIKHIEKVIYFPIALWNILEREGSATTAGYSQRMLTTHVSIEKMLQYPDNSEKVNNKLQEYKIRRIEQVMRTAIKAGIKKNYADLSYLRNTLKKINISEMSEMSIKEKAGFIMFTRLNYGFLKIITGGKARIKGIAKKMYYYLFRYM